VQSCFAAVQGGRLSFTSGWIRMQLSGETSLHRSAPASIFRFSGARFPSRQMPKKFHGGCRTLISIRKSYETSTPSLIGMDTPISLPARSAAGATLFPSENGGGGVLGEGNGGVVW
jgi:hypothetical protein